MKNNNYVSLEKELIQSIKGYSGYQTIKDREKTDKRLREHLLKEIKQIEKSFRKISNRIAKQGNTNIADTINKLINQLKNLIETLNKPSYNNSPFFSHPNLNSDTLLQLYRFESQLRKQVIILADEATELEKIEEPTETSEFLNHLFDVFDNLNQIIMEREFILAGGNDDDM